MTIEEIKKHLREIASKDGAKITNEDKAFVEQQSQAMHLAFNPCHRCRRTYADQAVVIWKKLQDATAKNNTRKYVLREGVDVYFGSLRVNEAMLTDDIAESIIAKGFPQKFFSKCK